MAAPAPAVRVTSLAGTSLAELRPVPQTLQDLKLELEKCCGMPVALQKLVSADGQVLSSDAALPADGCELICVKDETPLYHWDPRNPEIEQIVIEGTVVSCPRMKSDFVNVLTCEPLRSGVHYFEFVLHHVGDEQWCGVTMRKDMEGSSVCGRSLQAWTYYCGRSGRREGSIHNGLGALHACGKAVTEFKKACTAGNVINMLVDVEKRTLGFALDGELQGACKVPGTEPLYVMTQVDTPSDKVELRKLMLEDAPRKVLEALSGALLDAEKGEPLHW